MPLKRLFCAELQISPDNAFKTNSTSLRPKSCAIIAFKKNVFVLVLFTLLLTAGNSRFVQAQGKANSGALLAKSGRSMLPIVISEKASDSTKAVSAELSGYLERITGAKFEVKTGDGKSGIVLGTLKEFPHPELNRALEVRKTTDGKEAFAIRTTPQRLLLLGATDLGVPHAAFRLLESLGYRHFFPAPEWDVVPSIPALKVNLNLDDRPAVQSRVIWYGYGLFGDNKNRPRLDYQAWSRHNLMGSSFDVYAGHSWQQIISDNQATFDAHREYYAQVKDKDGQPLRSGPELCVSNVAVQKIAIDFARNFFLKNPDADMVSMEPSDGVGLCQCDECKKLGGDSEQAFYLANVVARAVQKEFPGKMVGLLAYSSHSEPPSFALEPNVYVQLTVGNNYGQFTFDELLDLWSKKTSHLGLYNYYSVWLWDFDKLPGGGAANISRLKKDIPNYVAHGATSITSESGNNWGPNGRGYYIANRLMWNPKSDVDALLADFYEKAFGPGAAAMRRYYERLDPGNKPLMSTHLLGLAFRDVQEASTLSKNRPDVEARLDDIKHYLRYVQLRWMLERETDKATKKALTLAIFTLTYRTRFSYMNHWEAIRQTWTAQAAADFSEPSWSAADPATKPWQVDAPTTQAETEKEFEEGLAYFKPQLVTEKTFSSDVVPVKFEVSPAAISFQGYQGAVRYLFSSIHGEPIQIKIMPGVVEVYRNRPAATYTLLSDKEQKVASGRLPLDAKWHNLELKVPAPGVYAFDFDDSSAAFYIEVAADKSVTIPLRREKGFGSLGQMSPLYFYVPKGTKQIDYYWSGNPHQIVGPDGKVIQEVSATGGDFVKVPVPAGMDGKTWHITGIALGHLWFFNIPNYLAASPNALLLPREIVQADGLTVQK